VEPVKKHFDFLDIPDLSLGPRASEVSVHEGTAEDLKTPKPPLIRRLKVIGSGIFEIDIPNDKAACEKLPSLSSRKVEVKQKNKRSIDLADVDDLTALMAGSGEIRGYYEMGHEVPPPPVKGYKIVREDDGLFYLVKLEDSEIKAKTAEVFKRLRK
jgi:hypothetical protein